MKRLNVITVVVCFVAFSSLATVLDFTFKENPNPKKGFSGMAPNNGSTFLDSSSGYGEHVDAAGEYPVWVKNHAGEWIHPVADITVGSEGATPHVDLVWYGTKNTIIFWSADFPKGFGDLKDAVYVTESGVAAFYLLADGGHKGKLNSFDMAGYDGADITDVTIKVADAKGKVLWSVENETIPGSGHKTFKPDVASKQVWVTITSASLSKVGIDNIVFSEVVPPE